MMRNPEASSTVHELVEFLKPRSRRDQRRSTEAKDNVSDERAAALALGALAVALSEVADAIRLRDDPTALPREGRR